MPEHQHRTDPRRPGRHRSREVADHRRFDEPFDEPTVALPAPAAGSVDLDTQPMPAVRGRHQARNPGTPRHRSSDQQPAGAGRHSRAVPPRHPVGRSLVGALAVIGVVGGVELTAGSLTGGASPDTVGGPVTGPATLSGLHALAPQFTPTPPGSDERRPATGQVPQPRRPADGGEPAGNREGSGGSGATASDRAEDGTDDRADEAEDRADDRAEDGTDDRAGGTGGVRADAPRLPDLPGLGLPGLPGPLPTLDGVVPPKLDRVVPSKPKAVSTANCGRPGKILDLANWKLTLPTGSSGDPTEIIGNALGGLTNKHFGTDNRCDAVAFRAPVNGVTTKGSKNPRSELREMSGGGSGKAGWSSTSGTHTMTVREAFTRLPSGKPHLVGAQIHDASDDVSVFRLEGNKLWVTNGDNPNFKLADADYKLGTPFEAKFVVSGGQTKAFYNGKLVATIPKAYSGAYFKAGAYTQANCGNAPCSSDNYGETLIYDLDVKHS